MPDSTPPGMPAPELHRRAQRSLWLVLSRQLLVTALTFGSGIVLARTLAPSDFGLFAIATFVIGFIGLGSEFGLHSALVQQSKDLGPDELRTAFTLQQLGVTLAMLVLWPATAWLPVFYPKAPSQLIDLVRVMSLTLYVASWGRPSEALLERTLRYDRLVPIDVAVTCTYCAVAILLALGGFGVWSFAVAFVIGSLLRLALLYRAAPWSVGLALDRSVARSLLRTGLPLQFGRVFTQGQYWITPTLVAGMIGPTAAGFLNWAAGNGRKPLDLLEYIGRVSLPHFSRLQHDEAEIARTLSRYLSIFVLVCGLWLCVLAVAGKDLVSFVYTDRWLPAVAAMILFAGVGVLVSIRIAVTSALTGLGRTALIARVSVVGAAVTIAASIVLVLSFGLIGVPLGQLVGEAAVLPLLTVGLGPGSIRRVLASAASALPPIVVAVPIGLAIQALLVDAGLRGLATATAMTFAYVATVWWAGPSWLRNAAQAKFTSARLQIGGRDQA